jgi:hypothetical protein
MRATLLALAAVALAGCGTHAAAPAPTYTARGVTVELPAGWQPAHESLTPQLSDPREVLSVGTYPLSYRRGECAQMPSSALADLGRGDAFVTIQERGRGTGPDGFPPRPDHFATIDAMEAVECVPDPLAAHWFGFSDGGRHFHVLVVFGPDAPTAVRDQGWAILDGLRVDPGVRPDWSSTG